MSHLESLALLIADLNTQIRALQEENSELKSQRVSNGTGTPNKEAL